jgi:hypothetical protein
LYKAATISTVSSIEWHWQLTTVPFPTSMFPLLAVWRLSFGAAARTKPRF